MVVFIRGESIGSTFSNFDRFYGIKTALSALHNLVLHCQKMAQRLLVKTSRRGIQRHGDADTKSG
jgi:hypothetical protein